MAVAHLVFALGLCALPLHPHNCGTTGQSSADEGMSMCEQRMGYLWRPLRRLLRAAQWTDAAFRGRDTGAEAGQKDRVRTLASGWIGQTHGGMHRGCNHSPPSFVDRCPQAATVTEQRLQNKDKHRQDNGQLLVQRIWRTFLLRGGHLLRQRQRLRRLMSRLPAPQR